MTVCFDMDELRYPVPNRLFLGNRMPSGSCSVSMAVVALLLTAIAATEPVAAAETPVPFKAGFAEKDITPEIGMEQPGGYGKAFHRMLHDPCKVRAAVFDDGTKSVAVAGIDALILHRPTVEAVRKRVTEQCGIPANAILIAASHSHSSGPTGMVLPGQFDDASPLVQKLAYEKSSMANATYLKHVEDQLVAAICEANEKRAEAACGVGKGIEDQVAFNRRFRMRSGLTQTHPRQGNPDIIEPAGPTDPEVGVIGAWNKEGKLVGCVVNFVCHATTSPGGISANYVYYLEKVVRGAFGDDVVVVFLAGASGDVTQVNNLDPYANRPSERWAEMVGGRVGAEAVKVLLTMDRGALAPVDSRNKMLKIRRRVPRPERVSRAMEQVQQEPKGDPTEWLFAKEIVMLDAIIKKEPVVDVEVQAIQVGPAVLVSDPAEYFCQYGLDIKRASKFPYTFPVSLANGCVGYVPTEEAFGPRGGGYETRLTSYSNLEVTAGRQMADAGIELANQLTPGAVPTRAKAAPFANNPWTYGAVPPEVD
jgi:hypothetical protein